MQHAADNSPLILFDGECNFCNASVQWVVNRDRRGIFRFAALSSNTASDALAKAGVERNQLPDCMVVIDANGVHTRSDAAIRVATTLGGVWSLAQVAKIVPRRIRDAVYAFVARHRRRIMGTPAECIVPAPDVASRLLDRDEDRGL